MFVIAIPALNSLKKQFLKPSQFVPNIKLTNLAHASDTVHFSAPSPEKRYTATIRIAGFPGSFGADLDTSEYIDFESELKKKTWSSLYDLAVDFIHAIPVASSSENAYRGQHIKELESNPGDDMLAEDILSSYHFSPKYDWKEITKEVLSPKDSSSGILEKFIRVIEPTRDRLSYDPKLELFRWDLKSQTFTSPYVLALYVVSHFPNLPDIWDSRKVSQYRHDTKKELESRPGDDGLAAKILSRYGYSFEVDWEKTAKAVLLRKNPSEILAFLEDPEATLGKHDTPGEQDLYKRLLAEGKEGNENENFQIFSNVLGGEEIAKDCIASVVAEKIERTLDREQWPDQSDRYWTARAIANSTVNDYRPQTGNNEKPR